MAEKITENKDKKDSVKNETPKKEEESKQIVEETKEIKKEGKKVEKESSDKNILEREYIIPLRKKSLNVPRYRRAKKAVKAVKEFLAKHMKVEGRDLNKVKVDIHLNNEIWFRGIKKPLHKVKVKAVKKEGIVYAELVEIPQSVEFVKARLEKRAKAAEATTKAPKTETPKEEEKDMDKDGVEDKKEESEDKKAAAETNLKKQKDAAKETKHTAKGAHLKKVAPVRKSLKK
jgi:large subunit ribosomal protein L31e